MSDHVVYVDRFQLREGKLEDFKRYATEMAELAETNEPGVVSFNYYVDEDGARGMAVFVFSDAQALDVHLDLAGSRFQEGYELLSATDIELLGRPSDQAIELARSFNASLKTKLAGFSRSR
jgi:quinol monooxygenase YgiN